MSSSTRIPAWRTVAINASSSAILAAGAARFAEYERQVRAEYAFVPDPTFAARRREILAAFLGRERSYSTPRLHGELELCARANLAAAIDALPDRPVADSVRGSRGYAEQVEELLRRALSDPERGLAEPPPVEDAALAMLAERSGGDARVALSGLERAVARASDIDHTGVGSMSATVDVAAVEDALQRKALDYDRQGDRHYDFISAWIKATRGSDVDASLYYLAVMLEGGEDPRFIARRMVILASEDVGNADPQALLVADAAARAVDRVGLPECALNLAQACVYLALAPKSNASYKALGRARGEVRDNGAKTPPDYLRDAHYPGAGELGRGEGYRYAHDEPGAVSDQPLLPPELQGRRFYEPTDRGFEAQLGRRLEALRKRLSGK